MTLAWPTALGMSEKNRRFTAATGACLLWNGVWWLSPQFVSFAIDRLRTPPAEAGLLLTVELGVIALTSMAAVRYLSRFSPFAFLAAAAALTFCGSFLCLFVRGVPAFLTLRAVAGIGEGLALMISSALVADFADPDRAYAQMNIVNIVFGAALIFMIPSTPGLLGGHPLFTALAGVSLLCAFLMAVAPRARPAAEVASEVLRRRNTAVWPFLLLCASLFVTSIATSGIYALAIELAGRAGVDEPMANLILSGAVIACVFGSGLTALISVRFGRLIPMSAGLLAAAGACYTLVHAKGVPVFALASTVDLVAVFFLLPFYFGHAARMDASGRFSARLGSVFLIAGAVSPLVAGLVVQTAGYDMLGFACLFLIAAGASLLLGAERVAVGTLGSQAA